MDNANEQAYDVVINHGGEDEDEDMQEVGTDLQSDRMLG